MMKRLCTLYIFSMLVLTQLIAQEVNVDINLNIRHSVDGVSDFGRERHMTVHASHTERDWNFDEDKLDYLINDLDVYFGRDNGSVGWKMRMVTEDPEKPHWPDTGMMTEHGRGLKLWYESEDYVDRHQYANKGRMIMGMVDQPVYPTIDWSDHGKTNSGWQTYDVDASAFWITEYLDKYFAHAEGEIGEALPDYWEAINEPDMTMLGAAAMVLNSPEKIWEYHNLLAESVRSRLGEKAPLIGGMTWGQHDFDQNDWTWRMDPQFYYEHSDPALYPVYDNMLASDVWPNRNDPWFTWDGMWQGFIDEAGANMDFYGVHIYDWPDANNGGRIRAGGHVEAMLDLLEWYDLHKFGEKKPIVLSEFGSVSSYVSDLPYHRKDWENLRPYNQMMMQFLERPSHIVLTMPFCPPKASWGDWWNPDGSLQKRYSATLMNPIGDYRAPGYDHEDWEWSSNILFYELWSDVDGTRIDTKASDLDVQVDAYVDGKHVYLILNNLEIEAATINLNFFDDYDNAIERVFVKHLYLNESLGDQGLPVIDEQMLATDPGSVVLEKSATMIIDYTFANDVIIDQTSVETKYPCEPITAEKNKYGSTLCHITVNGRQDFITHINNVIVPSGAGEAMVRIGGSYWDKTPESVTVNGHELISGEYDPRGRITHNKWYGMFEVPCPVEYLQTNNTVVCRVDGNVSEYSTSMLQIWDFSKAPGRSEDGDSMPVTSIGLGEEVSIMQGQSEALYVDFLPVNASNKKINWSSSNEAVAKVDEFGVVTAVASSGTAVITAISADNASATATQTIRAIQYTPMPVSGIQITNGSDLTVEYYVTTPLEALITPADATIKDIVWSSSNPDNVSVDPETGKATGKMINRTAVITATLTDVASGNSVHEASISVYVTIAGEEGVYCYELPEFLRPFQTVSVEVPVRTMGEREVIVELSKNSSLIGEGSARFTCFGDTTIEVGFTLDEVPVTGSDYLFTAKLMDGVSEINRCSKELEMIPHIAVDSVVILDGIPIVAIGESIQRECIVFPADAYNKEVSWSSADPTIASVDPASGNITGVGTGITTITVTSEDGGHTDGIEIESKVGPIDLDVEQIIIPSAITLYPGMNRSLDVQYIPSYTTQTNITWSSTNASIADVNAEGLITSTQTEGTTIIVATSTDNPSVYAECVVTVSKTIVVQAEDFVNTGGPYDGFQIYTVGETGGINWNQLGDWGEYEVDFPMSGDYSVVFYIGTPTTSGIAVNLYLDGVLQSTTPLSATGGWDDFTAQSGETTMSITAGTHIIRIESAGTSEWQWNCDRLEFSLGGSVIVPASLEFDDRNKYASTEYQVGGTMEVVVEYHAGTGNTVDDEYGGVQFFLREMKPDWVNVVNDYLAYDASAIGSESGTATGSISLEGVKTTAELDDGNFYFLWVRFHTSDGRTIDLPGIHPLTIVTGSTIPVESVSVSPSSGSIFVGTSITLSAEVLPVNATDKSVSWSSSDIELATVNEGVVNGVAPGYVTITATTNDGSYSSSSSINVVENVGLQQQNWSKVSLYPNPAKSTLFINGLESGIFKVRIYNVLGEQVRNVLLTTEGENSFSIDDLDSGMYFLRIGRDDNNTNFRFIKSEKYK